MSGPARAGGFIYAKDLSRLADFYRSLLSMDVLLADEDHQVMESADIQLVLHAIPAPIAATFSIASPPALREETALKFFFTVPSLAWAEPLMQQRGGGLVGPIWQGPGFVARNGFDPEGNLFQLREWRE